MNKSGLLLLTIFTMTAFAQQSSVQLQNDSKTPMAGRRVVCDAAAAKLRETSTSQVALVLTIASSGKVESFETELPKGLRLEKVKSVVGEVKAMRFEPAKKNGRPVAVKVRVTFDCSAPLAATTTPNE